MACKGINPCTRTRSVRLLPLSSTSASEHVRPLSGHCAASRPRHVTLPAVRERVRLVSTDPGVEDVFMDIDLERGESGILEPVLYEGRSYSFSHTVVGADEERLWLEF